MLYRLDTSQATTQALCATPTRELAIQIVEKVIRPLSVNFPGPTLHIALAVAQCDRPLHTPHVVVGTPGKVVDWLKRRVIVTKHVRVFVLDEADVMVEEGGHRANSLLISKQLPQRHHNHTHNNNKQQQAQPDDCQYLFFSATFDASVVQFAGKIMSSTSLPVDKILIANGPEDLVGIFCSWFACGNEREWKIQSAVSFL